MNPKILQQQFTQPLLHWQQQFGRQDLPWQHPKSAYGVWVSEIMLQQTQVLTVIPFFERFMKRFPTLDDLAQAPEEDVLNLWSGLGYYSRARNLHQTAKILWQDYQGNWPKDVDSLMTLPGIGRSTAAAIASLAFDQPTAILDGNVRRVLCRYFKIEGYPLAPTIQKKLWALAQACMSHDHCARYTQAIMDLGATCCTSRKPQCTQCPLQANCCAYQQNCIDQFPQKKPPKTIPTKEQLFLLIENNQHEIYLKKNPPSGIWGSLWCLPHLTLEQNPVDYLSQFTTAEHIQIRGEFMHFKHTFSHFHLMIHAISTQLTASPMPLVHEPNGQWFTRQALTTLGLPKAVSRIINEFLMLNVEQVEQQ